MKVSEYRRLMTAAKDVYRRSLNSGELKRGSCEVCGNPKVHGHHDDYRKPLQIRWLCHKHHKAQHARKSQSYQFLGDDSFDPRPVEWGVRVGKLRNPTKLSTT